METRALPTVGRRMFAPLATLRDEMDKLFNDWLTSANLDPSHLFDGDSFMPRIDVKEHEKSLEITAELPGIDREDVEIELTKTALVLTGQKKVETEEKTDAYVRTERRYGAFHRQVALPWEVDVATTAPEATFVNGVLKVTVPKPAGVMPPTRKVPINS